MGVSNALAEPIRKRIELRGAAREILSDRSPEVLVAGSAGTGKSFASLYKIHLMCLLNGACPKDCAKEHEHHLTGMRALIARKTAKSLTSTGLVTFREQVAADAIAQGILKWYGGSSERPAQYQYSNGSVIVVGGLDNADKIMSAEYDIIFIQEATDCTIEDWEKCNSRLRNGRVSFQQLLADCNPQQPSHPLKKRCDEGLTKMLISRHEDNPRLFDGAGQVTPYGADYIKRLDNLTGVRRERLRFGRWAAAEGMIYESWRPELNLSDRKLLPLDWPRIWGVDFGYTNPFVWQMWAIDPDGRMYLEKEIYRTQRLVEDHAKDILAVVTRGEDGRWKYPRPQAIVCDHDAEDRATLERHIGIGTVPANKNVSEGIQAVQSRIRVAGDGLPRLFICRDALVSRDDELHQAGKPTCTKDEVEGYVWEPSPDGKPVKDKPLKINDHGMDAGRYVVAYQDLGARARVRFFDM
jgi:PBSX family phage terminase large subunit